MMWVEGVVPKGSPPIHYYSGNREHIISINKHGTNQGISYSRTS